MNRTKVGDAIVALAWKMLARDFQTASINTSSTRCPFIDRAAVAAGGGDVERLRNLQIPGSADQLSPGDFKRLVQLRDFGKRWIFADDVMSPEEREKASYEKFFEVQNNVLQALPDTPIVNRVLDGASQLCSYILGPYDEEEHKRRCRFGVKAAYNLKGKDAYLFNRIPRLSATRPQVARWGSWLAEDFQLANIIARHERQLASQGLTAVVATTDSLALVAVPKSWKICRTIVPDTVLGGFIANGLGAMMQQRLLVNAGLDLRYKQHEHKRVARAASNTGHLATVDLSSASDYISWPLLQRVLPPDWLSVIETDRVHWVHYESSEGLGQACKATKRRVFSPLLMGKGYTFPLQTLVFYSLLLSIADQLGSGHKYISVYGDDLIYPSKMHKYVLPVFSALGLKVNLEKTFSGPPTSTMRKQHGCFRESCGGDFLCGQEVRPYQPQGDSNSESFSTPTEIAALCYTVTNGLLSRWEWWEVRTTVRALLIQAHNALGKILVVPRTCAVSAGLRLDGDGCTWLYDIEENFNVVFPQKFSQDWVQSYRFESIETDIPTQVVPREGEWIYLWDSLRIMQSRDEAVQGAMNLRQEFRRIPGYLEEWARVHARSNYEVAPERFERVEKKMFIDKFNRLHQVRPEGPYQVVWESVGAVDSKGKEQQRFLLGKRKLTALEVESPCLIAA